MAIIPVNRYPGAINPTDTNYPYGSAKNVDGGNGTPFEEGMVNDDWGFKQALLKDANISPNNLVETAVASQYLDAILDIVNASKNIALTQNNAVNPNTHIDILPNSILDSTKKVVIKLQAQITKRIDLTWAEGNGLGGRFSGVNYVTNGNYHLFLIMKADKTVDAGFDDNIDCTHIPAGYTYFRRVASFRVDGAKNFFRYIQNKEYFSYLDTYLTTDTPGKPPAGVIQTLASKSLPQGIVSLAHVGICLISCNNVTLGTIIPVNGSVGGSVFLAENGDTVGLYDNSGTGLVHVNTAGQISYFVEQGSSVYLNLEITVYGYFDTDL